MTTIKVAKEGMRTVVSIEGHTQFAKTGKDIVCAATSMLSYTLANNLLAECGAKVDVADGAMVIDVKGFKARRIIKTMLTGYEMLAKSYPKNVRVMK